LKISACLKILLFLSNLPINYSILQCHRNII
jgi:hypothetical protein